MHIGVVFLDVIFSPVGFVRQNIRVITTVSCVHVRIHMIPIHVLPLISYLVIGMLEVDSDMVLFYTVWGILKLAVVEVYAGETVGARLGVLMLVMMVMVVSPACIGGVYYHNYHLVFHTAELCLYCSLDIGHARFFC